jgi:two-component system sensor histidine kinase SenX3
MDVRVAAVLAALTGVVAGALMVLALVRPVRTHRARESVAAPAPSGVRGLLAVLSSAAVLVDDSDVVVDANPGAYSSGLVRADGLAAGSIRQLLRGVRRDRAVGTVEMELPRGPLGGETYAALVRAAPLNGHFVVVIAEDRTEARRVDAVRRDFVANVSHELKTPIGALLLLAEAIFNASGDPDAVERFAQRMRIEASRLSNLVQELLDLSRLQDHGPLHDGEVVSVDEVVEEAVERCRTSATAKSISLVISRSGGLTVFGVRSQLITAVRNLVENAVTYSPDHTRVRIIVRSSGALVEIRVSDEGIGIPEPERERIFERFYRVDPARSRATGGTGLGLSIVKHVLANHGGEVTVWSVEGSGSTFTLRLPVSTDRAGISPLREART